MAPASGRNVPDIPGRCLVLDEPPQGGAEPAAEPEAEQQQDEPQPEEPPQEPEPPQDETPEPASETDGE